MLGNYLQQTNSADDTFKLLALFKGKGINSNIHPTGGDILLSYLPIGPGYFGIFCNTTCGDSLLF